MTITRHDVINEVLARVDNLGFEMGPGFTSHAPMAAEALVALGHLDRAESWIDRYIRDVPHFPRPDTSSRINPRDESDWRNALGEIERLGDWVVLFRHELGEAPWQEVLARWWPRLVPGFLGGLTHGLVRTAHAVRTVAEDPAPTARQLNELGDALAYLAAQYSPLPGEPRPNGTRPIREALASIPPLHPREAIGAGVHSRRGGKPGNSEGLVGFEEAVNELEAPVDLDAALLAMSHQTAIALRNRAATNPPAVKMIASVHMVTAPAAARMLLPHLPPDVQLQTYARVWQVTAALASAFGGGLSVPAGDAERQPLTPAELDARAVEHGAAHAIKLTEACLREYQASADPGYLFVAEDVVPHIVITASTPGG